MSKKGRGGDKLWGDALRIAVKRIQKDDPQGRVRLAIIAEKVTKMAMDGDMDAIKEIGNRIDGRPHQSIDTSGDVNVNLTDTRDAADEFTRLVADRIARAGQAGSDSKPH